MSADNKADAKLEAKFNYLFQEINNNHKDTQMFIEMDNLIQSKFYNLINIINSKIETKCKEEIEKLHVYTDFNKDLANSVKNSGSVLLDTTAKMGENFSFDNRQAAPTLTPTKGYEKEFEEALNNFRDCTSELKFIENDVHSNSKAISDLSINSNHTCLEECKNDLKKKRNSEYESRKCIEACLRYRKYNLEAYYKIMLDNIQSKEKILEKI